MGLCGNTKVGNHREWLMLQIKDLKVSQWKESYIGLTQENSIENSVQDCLPYIPQTHGPY